jgi:short-subunit dehydrogenase
METGPTELTVITGASSGIGRGLAVELARRGVAVGLLARRKDALEETAALVRASGGTAIVCPCDVTDRAQVVAAFDDIERRGLRIVRVIANAGGGRRVAADELRGQDVAAMLALNVLGAAYCVEAALPRMLARGEGHLVFMGSLAGALGLPRAGGYSAAKAAVARLGESLRVELRPRGIDVTVLQPGFVATRERRRPRPFEVPLPKAVDRMCDAILARRSTCRFPWTLVVLVGLASVLPVALTDRLLRRLGG